MNQTQNRRVTLANRTHTCDVLANSSDCTPFVAAVEAAGVASAPLVTGVADGSGLPTDAIAALPCNALHKLSSF